MKPKVIWLDDEIKSPVLKGTLMFFRKDFDIVECETIDKFNEAIEKGQYDAVILDVLNEKGEPTDIWRALISSLNNNILYFVFSGQEKITKEDHDIKKVLGHYPRDYADKQIYVKSKDEERLIEDIKKAVENKEEYKVRLRYEKPLKILKEYCEKYNEGDVAYKELVDIFSAISGLKEIDYNLYYTRLRRILELVFRKAADLYILHEKCIDKGRVNLTDSCCFLSGRPAIHSKVQCGKSHFPEMLSKQVWQLLSITGEASHTSKSDNNLTYHKDIDSPYLLYSLTFILCDLLLWSDTYFKKNCEKEDNKKLWKDIKPSKDDYLNYKGEVEEDENGNYHVGECSLSYKNHPEVGSIIKITAVVDNTKDIIKERYPYFAKEYTIC